MISKIRSPVDDTKERILFSLASRVRCSAFEREVQGGWHWSMSFSCPGVSKFRNLLGESHGTSLDGHTNSAWHKAWRGESFTM